MQNKQAPSFLDNSLGSVKAKLPTDFTLKKKTYFESTSKAYKSHENSSLQEVLVSHKRYFIQKFWNVPRY